MTTRKKKTLALFAKMKRVLIVLLLLSTLLAPVYSHGDGNGHDEEQVIPAQSVHAVLPFAYIANGKYFSAILVIVFWITILKGIYELSILMIGRATIKRKK